MEARKAVALAEDLGLDLVQVSESKDSPVCKIMDYGKYKYENKKKAKDAKKKQTNTELKEVQVRPKTETHDLTHKAKKTLGFLADGNKTKLIVFYRGFELSRIEDGYKTMLEFIEILDDKAQLETPPKMEGRKLSCILAPIPAAKLKKLMKGHLLASMPKFDAKKFKAPERPSRPTRRR